METLINSIIEKYDINNSFSASTGSQHFICNSERVEICSPIDNSILAKVQFSDLDLYNKIIDKAVSAKTEWASIPAPKRGEIIRHLGDNFRKHKETLAQLITLEMGKTITEARGEVQEVIDICDFAVGLSRQLYANTMQSERAKHRMYEQYHPLGVVGIISAFNFPVAVWSWNAVLAAICGNVSVWKPSELTPLTAIATQKIIAEVVQLHNLPEGVFNVVIGGKEIGETIASDKRIDLVSATGSTKMGKEVAVKVAQRFGKSLLELGGNNAIIVTSNADIKLAVKASIFGVVGTCGQRCTTTRRIIIHENVYDDFKNLFLKKIKEISIGNPLSKNSLIGPLVNINAVNNYIKTINIAKEEGHKLIFGGNVLNQIGTNYVEPTVFEIEVQTEIVKNEVFVPIVYFIKYSGNVDAAIQIQNDVPQGLSSSIFTNNLIEAEEFLSHKGSDCGIANVNIGTSGAEIGGAFGGEKETGGGRESGSDSWKVYMRRQTNTINYSNEIALAQGVIFDLDQ